MEANVAKSAVTGQDERESQRARSRKRRLEMKVGGWGGRGCIEEAIPGSLGGVVEN